MGTSFKRPHLKSRLGRFLRPGPQEDSARPSRSTHHTPGEDRPRIKHQDPRAGAPEPAPGGSAPRTRARFSSGLSSSPDKGHLWP